MSKKKYTEEELIEGGKVMLEGPFRFIDVFKWVKERTSDDEEMRARVLEKIKQDESAKNLHKSHLGLVKEEKDYVTPILGVMIFILGFIVLQMGLTTGYIFFLPVGIMGVGVIMMLKIFKN